MASNNVRTKKMTPNHVVALARILEACAPKILSVILPPKAVPSPSLRVLCISTAITSKKQIPTWKARRTGRRNLLIAKSKRDGAQPRTGHVCQTRLGM